jgi:hypothetical protein
LLLRVRLTTAVLRVDLTNGCCSAGAVFRIDRGFGIQPDGQAKQRWDVAPQILRRLPVTPAERAPAPAKATESRVTRVVCQLQLGRA